MDAVKLIVALLFLMVPFALAGLWWWVYTWAAIAIVLALMELISYLKDKKTISQKFWAWWKTGAVWKKVLIISGMILFWAYLILHLVFGW